MKGGSQWEGPHEAYQISEGETLYGIANRTFGGSISVKELKKWNNLSSADVNNLQIGQRLMIVDPDQFREWHKQYYYKDNSFDGRWNSSVDRLIKTLDITYGLIMLITGQTWFLSDPIVPDGTLPDEQKIH